MCGIVAVRGTDAGRSALRALRELEYRGYDSAGIGIVGDDEHIRIARAVGPLDALVKHVQIMPGFLDAPGRLAIGHTRWATHGHVTVNNAHPLIDCAGRIAVVHNGMLDNAADLALELTAAGHRLTSDVDSELIAHLIEEELAKRSDPSIAVREALGRLEGTWAIAALIGGVDAVLLARRRSPLLVRGTARRWIAASDVVALAGTSGPIRELNDGDVVELGMRWRWTARHGANGRPRPLRDPRVTATTKVNAMPDATTPARGQATAIEIAEQDAIVARIVDDVLTRQGSQSGWRRLCLSLPTEVSILGCGTSYHAGQVIARTIQALTGVAARAVIASEYDHRPHVLDRLTIAISQSGETADLLSALEGIDSPVMAITNQTWSSLARRADVVVDCHAGCERGVAATKSFTAQVLSGVGVAMAMAHANGASEPAADAARVLRDVPAQFAAANALGCPVAPSELARLAHAPGWMFLGTGSGLAYAAEGALKLKEITYRWAECHPASELKHGPLALVERDTPVIVVDNGARRLASVIAEVAARGACVVRIADPQCAADRGRSAAPWGPLATIPPLQHLAHTLGRLLDRNIDQPRNLAKSVTVL